MSDLYRELRQVICELELVSHAGAANYDFAAPPKGRTIPPGKWGQGGVTRKGSSESRGGESPGGINKEQREEDYYRDDEPDETRPERLLRSAEHFKRRIVAAEKAKARESVYELILEEAQAALETWKRQPAPTSEPEYGTPQWKRYVAESSESHGELSRRFNVSRSYIQKVRRMYGDDG